MTGKLKYARAALVAAGVAVASAGAVGSAEARTPPPTTNIVGGSLAATAQAPWRSR